MASDSTTRLLQILRTTEALIKYYEGHPDSAAVLVDLKKHLRRTIEELAMIDAAERAGERQETDFPETLDSEDIHRSH
jgi:hypothetical protein